MLHPIKHFIVITRHRHKVMRYCFRCGLYRQGLLHDLSKYGFKEFWLGAKYYVGTKSPHYKERLAKGYSEGWMHHKGRNMHHGEYWVDVDPVTKVYAPVKMPDCYLAESLCDRIAASENYNRQNFDRKMVLDYYLNTSLKHEPLHEESKKKLQELIELYVEKGKKAVFKYIKKNMRHKKATY